MKSIADLLHEQAKLAEAVQQNKWNIEDSLVQRIETLSKSQRDALALFGARKVLGIQTGQQAKGLKKLLIE